MKKDKNKRKAVEQRFDSEKMLLSSNSSFMVQEAFKMLRTASAANVSASPAPTAVRARAWFPSTSRCRWLSWESVLC